MLALWKDPWHNLCCEKDGQEEIERKTLEVTSGKNIHKENQDHRVGNSWRKMEELGDWMLGRVQRVFGSEHRKRAYMVAYPSRQSCKQGEARKAWVRSQPMLQLVPARKTHGYKPSTWKVGAGELLWFLSHPELQSKILTQEIQIFSGWIWSLFHKKEPMPGAINLVQSP